MAERDIKIYIVATGSNDPSVFNPPLTKEELQIFNDYRKWAEEQRKKTDKPIIFDIPFDP